ncbi:MAG: sulfatase-like hydrolase/transferase [Muribaculaceae bacterium]|nr:sulfatase-like hydrolase/transferase [Muribaculaceae bacterium]
MIWYFTVAACLLFDWWMMKTELGFSYSNAFGTLSKAVGDVALVLIPYWILPPRWRWSAILPVCLMSVWCIANLAYYRFWGDLIPSAAFTMGGNVDGSLFKYGMALLRWSDLLFILSPCVAWIVMVRIRLFQTSPFSTKIKLGCLGISLIIGFLGQMSYFKSTSSWRGVNTDQSLKEDLYDHFIGGYTGQKQLYIYNGPIYYCVRFIADAVSVLTSSIDLDDSQKELITGFLSRYERNGNQDVVDYNYDASCERMIDPDSVNVVYIIVESLNADMVGKKIGGMEVMPVLDSLSGRNGTVVFDNVVSQIKAASSSDGHLLLLTGLLPPEKIAYSIMYGAQNTYPSLADVLPDHHKYLLLADDGVCWNEGKTLCNFGLGDPLVMKDRAEFDVNVFGRDGAMFMQAIDMVSKDKVKTPFLMTLMTISMHIPFTEEAWKLPQELIDAEGISDMEKDYANMCHNTDRYIGEFLKCLPENTIVFIASDHHQSVATDSKETPMAFFMALHTGRTERVSRVVGQVNLFPATLDILGYRGSYGGLAPSAFNPDVDGSVDSYGNIYGNPSKETLGTLSEAYRISDLIIRGDFFRK